MPRPPFPAASSLPDAGPAAPPPPPPPPLLRGIPVDATHTQKSIKALASGLLAVLDAHSAELLACELGSACKMKEHVSAKAGDKLGSPAVSGELALCVPARKYVSEDSASRPAHGIVMTRNLTRSRSFQCHKNESARDVVRKRTGNAHLIQIDDVFRHIDLNRDGFLSLDEFHGQIAKLSKERWEASPQFDSALFEIKDAKPFLFSNTEEIRISVKLFEELLLGNLNYLSPPNFDVIMTFRRICVDEYTRDDVAKRIRLDAHELLHPDADETKRGLLFWLEPISGFAILLNALCLGASIDIAPESVVWLVMEGLFTLFFLLELVVKIKTFGCKYFFFGRDWKWNLFDVAIVALANYDFSLVLAMHFREIQGKEGSFGNLTMLRVARVLRITRIVRLVRIKALKDLTLMINGIFSGLRTLFWAFILLFSFVYALAVFLHQWMADWKMRTDCSGQTPCSPAEQTLYDVYDMLFSDLFRSCMTVLRCFCGDCTLPNGTPMEPYLFETQGSLLIVCFTCAYLFVVFGIVNLIAAVFVDNTIQSSSQDHMKRYQLRKKEHIKMARSLHSFIGKITKTGSTRKTTYTDGKEDQAFLVKCMRKLRGWFAIDDSVDEEEVDDSIHVSVSKSIFEDAMTDPEAEEMLDKLGVSIANREKLFDILDSDGNGFLTVDEIVDGLMRLRGPADKGDIVSASLMIRSLQRSFSELHSMFEDHIASRPFLRSGTGGSKPVV